MKEAVVIARATARSNLAEEQKPYYNEIASPVPIDRDRDRNDAFEMGPRYYSLKELITPAHENHYVVNQGCQ